MRKSLLILTLCLICLLLPVRALAGTGEISGTVFADDGSGQVVEFLDTEGVLYGNRGDG